MANDLTVTISESITLEGNDFSQSAVKVYSDIEHYTKFIKKLPSGAYTTLYTCSADGTSADYNFNEVEYVRITNLDADNDTYVMIYSNGENYVYNEIPPGSFFIIQNHESITDNDEGLDDIVAVKAGQATHDVKIEVFIAINPS